jgi:CubicO group peptidase (beta-lactamase class C family)
LILKFAPSRYRDCANFRIGTLAKVLGACVLLAACTAPAPPPPPPPPAELWPTTGWTFSTPEAQGFDSNTLADAIATIRARRLPIHSLFMERNGRAVLDVYFFPFQDRETHDLASVTKSVVSTLVGIAQRDGKLGTLDQPILSIFPDKPVADPVKARITLVHLLSMTSGLDCSGPPGVDVLREMENSRDWVSFTLNLPERAEPGTQFEYCGESLHVVSAALTRTTGESAFSLASRELFAPLAIQAAIWPADPQGNSRGFADLELQPRDAAKLGYLWLHHGVWKGSQIVPANYLADALVAHATVQQGIQYGFGMWLYPGHVPFDFEANGRGGQRITVVPDESIVTVVTAGGADANVVAPLLAAAFRSYAPLPANEIGDARLAAAVADAARPPVGFAAPPVPPWARAIGGITYVVSNNPFGLRSLALSFPPSGDASIRLGFADGTSGDHPIGFDGVPRLSPDPATGHRVALSGRWSANGLDLDYNEIARIDDFHLRITLVAGDLSIHLLQRTGPIDVMLSAAPM